MSAWEPWLPGEEAARVQPHPKRKRVAAAAWRIKKKRAAAAAWRDTPTKIEASLTVGEVAQIDKLAAEVGKPRNRYAGELLRAALRTIEG